MVEVREYHLPPTRLVPNSPRIFTSSQAATTAYDTFTANKWRVQWIFRYGQTQRSHYHSSVHECMAVLSGTATIRFGVADTSEDMGDNTFGNAREEGGIELQAKAGDAFIVPAGMAHKTYATEPKDSFVLLTPGDGHRVDGEDVRAALEETETRITGFTMIGAYPKDGGEWDSREGGEDVGAFDNIWNVPIPELDPVLGDSEQGLRGLWT